MNRIISGADATREYYRLPGSKRPWGYPSERQLRRWERQPEPVLPRQAPAPWWMPRIRQAATFVQTAQQNSGAATTVVLTLAAAPKPGNLLLVALSFLGGNGVTAPAGYTQIDAGTYNTDSLRTYRKVAGLDSNTYTFTITGTSDHCSGVLYEIQGSHPTSPINQNGISAGSTGTTHATPSKTPSVIGCLAMAFLAMDDATCTLAVAGGGLTAPWVRGVQAYGGAATFHPLSAALKPEMTVDTSTAISVTFTTVTSTASGGINDGLAAIVLIAPSVTPVAYKRVPWQQRML